MPGKYIACIEQINRWRLAQSKNLPKVKHLSGNVGSTQFQKPIPFLTSNPAIASTVSSLRPSPSGIQCPLPCLTDLHVGSWKPVRTPGSDGALLPVEMMGF